MSSTSQFRKTLTLLSHKINDLNRIAATTTKPIDCRVTMDYSSIFNKFPHLEHLKLLILYNVVRKEEQIFEGLLSKNPQIKSIETNKMSNYLYNFTQKYQLNIEHLNVTQFHVKGAHFDHLKSLVVTYIDRKELEELSVPQLESIETNYHREVDTEWIPFLQRNRNLSRLTIHDLIADGGNKIIQMISHIPNLAELTIDHNDKYLPIPTYAFISEVINEIIKRSEKLEKFNFMTQPVLTEGELNIIREKYENDWELIVDRYQRDEKDVINFSFVKKKII